MEQENARLIQQAYQCIKTGDLAPLLDLLAADVQWRLPEMENVPFSGTWHGREEVAQFFGKVSALQDVIEFEPEEFIAQADKVVVLGRFTMRLKSTGGAFSSKWAHVWTVRGGKIVDFCEYVDTAVVSRAHTAAQTR